MAHLYFIFNSMSGKEHFQVLPHTIKCRGIIDINDVSPLVYPSHTTQFHTGIRAASGCWLMSTLTVNVVWVNVPGTLSRARPSTVQKFLFGSHMPVQETKFLSLMCKHNSIHRCFRIYDGEDATHMAELTYRDLCNLMEGGGSVFHAACRQQMKCGLLAFIFLLPIDSPILWILSTLDHNLFRQKVSLNISRALFPSRGSLSRSLYSLGNGLSVSGLVLSFFQSSAELVRADARLKTRPSA